jgi:ribonuclease D
MRMTSPKIHLHKSDLPADVDLGNDIAVDCEMMGLSLIRDRLCLIQLRGRDGDIHIVQILNGQDEAPNLKKILEDEARVKIFHYARTDIAMIKAWLDINCAPVYCTKIASKLVRTYTDRHGYSANIKELKNVDVSKQQTTTDWGRDELTPEQLEYAAVDVLHLHDLKDHMIKLLDREGRTSLAQACFNFLPARAALDLLDWEEKDIFSHA